MCMAFFPLAFGAALGPTDAVAVSSLSGRVNIPKKAIKENVIVFESQYWVVNISQLINCFMENNILVACSIKTRER